MTDTQAPDTSREYIQRMIACAPFADQTAGIPEMVATLRALLAERDLADARAAAAYKRGIESSEAYTAGWDAAFAMMGKGAPSTDTAALDRLISERVREALIEARDLIADRRTAQKPGPLFGAYNEAIGDVEAVRFRRARGSKEGQS